MVCSCQQQPDQGQLFLHIIEGARPYGALGNQQGSSAQEVLEKRAECFAKQGDQLSCARTEYRPQNLQVPIEDNPPQAATSDKSIASSCRPRQSRCLPDHFLVWHQCWLEQASTPQVASLSGMPLGMSEIDAQPVPSGGVRQLQSIHATSRTPLAGPLPAEDLLWAH